MKGNLRPEDIVQLRESQRVQPKVIPPLRVGVTFRDEKTGDYAQTHISDDRVYTLCMLRVPPVCFEPGPRGELVWVNTHPISCAACLKVAEVGGWH